MPEARTPSAAPGDASWELLTPELQRTPSPAVISLTANPFAAA